MWGSFPPGKFIKHNGLSGSDVKISVHQLGHRFTNLSRNDVDVYFVKCALGTFEQQFKQFFFEMKRFASN